MHLGSHARHNMVLEGWSQNRGIQQLLWRVAKVGFQRPECCICRCKYCRNTEALELLQYMPNESRMPA